MLKYKVLVLGLSLLATVASAQVESATPPKVSVRRFSAAEGSMPSSLRGSILYRSTRKYQFTNIWGTITQVELTEQLEGTGLVFDESQILKSGGLKYHASQVNRYTQGEDSFEQSLEYNSIDPLRDGVSLSPAMRDSVGLGGSISTHAHVKLIKNGQVLGEETSESATGILWLFPPLPCVISGRQVRINYQWHGSSFMPGYPSESGRQTNISVSFSGTIPNTPPSLSAPQATPPTVESGQGSVRLSVAASDDIAVSSVSAQITGPNGISFTRPLRLTAGTAKSGTWSVDFPTPPNTTSTPQRYTVVFNATDNEGAKAAPTAPVNFEVTPSRTTTAIVPPDEAVVSPATVFQARAERVPNVTGVVEFDLEVDGSIRSLQGTFAVGDTATFRLNPEDKNGLKPGKHTWRIRARAGNDPWQWSSPRSLTVYGGVDISYDAVSETTFRKIYDAGWSFAIVDAWGGTGRKRFPAASNLAAADAAGLRIAAYCLLNFDNSAVRGADGRKAPKKQTGTWQVRQALIAIGASLTRFKDVGVFLAIDVESFYLPVALRRTGRLSPSQLKAKKRAQAAAVERIQEAVDAVRAAGLRPVIYTKNSLADPKWEQITGNTTRFSDLGLWVSRPDTDIAIQRDNLELDFDRSLGGWHRWTRFGGWLVRVGKQYAVSDTGTKMFGLGIDLDVFDPVFFGEAF